MRIKILDIIIFLIILAAGIFLTLRSVSEDTASVIVTANGEEFMYSKDGTYSVQGLIGTTTFEIKDGKVHITDSCCPNKTCVAQGWTSPIICLPNKVVIRAFSKGDFDAVSN